LNIPSIYIQPPILFVPSSPQEGFEVEDDTMFNDLNPAKLQDKYRTLTREYTTTLNDFRKLENQRMTMEKDLFVYRDWVDIIEQEVLGIEAEQSKTKKPF
jgi:hypothetical protein